jgi:DivIVA domain-containing protein
MASRDDEPPTVDESTWVSTRDDDPVAEVRDVRFPTTMMGYSRPAVDAYVAHVARLVADLSATR